MDGVRGHRRLAEALQNQLQLPRIGRHVADREHAGHAGLAGGRVDPHVVAFELEPHAAIGPRSIDSPKNGSSTSASSMRVSPSRSADLDRVQRAARAVQRVQLIGDDQLDLARARRRIELAALSGAARNFGAAMHDRDRAAMPRSASAQSTAESPPPAITTRLPRKSSRRRT